MLLEVERYISRKVAKWICEIPGRGLLAPRVDRKLQESLESDHAAKVEQVSRVTFIVSTKKHKGALLRQFSVLLDGSQYSYSCGIPVDMMAPCIHVMVCLREANPSELASSLFHST